ncbi:MAG: lysylphosphatidylglycerol synthase transmembrane domain-containing protein [Candidatus Thermoplasmatota archaeon]
MKKEYQSKLKRIFPFAGIVIFIYTIYSLDIGKLKEGFLSIHLGYILISLSLNIPRLLIRNYIWKLIQREQKINLSFLESLKLFLIGYFYGSITPGFMGKFLRITYIKEKIKEPYGKLFINTFLESVTHQLSLFGMVLLGSLLIVNRIPELFYLITTWVFVLGVILFYFSKRNRGEKFFKYLTKIFVIDKIKKPIKNFFNSFYKDFPELKKLFLPTFIGIVTWIILFSQYYIFVIPLEVDISYIYFLLLFPVANMVSIIPISFAGIGTRELTAVLLFSTLFSINQEKIFIISLLGFILTDLTNGFLGFVFSIRTNKKTDRDQINH